MKKVLVIVGPTASGKTSLSVKLATLFDGEIVSADSRQVYRGLDIGTGKVTKEEMRGIPHHLLDVVNPCDTYTVADFVRDGRKAIEDIFSGNKLPIIVGGSFFYIDALLGRVAFPEVPPNLVLRTRLDALTTEQLLIELRKRDPNRADVVDSANRHRLIRALEITEKLGVVPFSRSEPLYDTLILGINIDTVDLQKNIHERLVSRLDAGMIDEVKKLHADGLSYERMEDIGLEYRYISQYLKGTLSYDEMISVLETKTRQYAKRQMTWLKRDAEIVWIDKNNTEHIESLIRKFIKN